MPYSKKSGETLLTQVVDIPMGSGKDDKTHKQLFQPPFLAEAKNIEVDKTGSVQKRDGIQSVIPSSVNAQPYNGTGTLFEHPGAQLGVVGQPNFPVSDTSLAVVAGGSSFASSSFVPSNSTGIYASALTEDPVVRSEEAILHVQTHVSGNKVITVWCAQINPPTQDEAYNVHVETDNRCYYMVKEKDTGTVVVHPTRLFGTVAGTGVTVFTNQPRYTHIALVDSVDPHWVVVAAPEVYSETAWQYLSAASISASDNSVTYNRISFTDGQTPVERFVAFDMDAGQDSTYAHILAQSYTGAGTGDYLIRIDKTLAISQYLLLGTTAKPEHSGAIYHDATNNFVFTATSTDYGIAGALPGDGECYVHRYDMTYTASSPFYPVKVFAHTAPTGANDIGITGACTRLTIGPGSPSSVFVFGTQFWNPLGYARIPTNLQSVSASQTLRTSLMRAAAGTKSILNTKWVEISDAFTSNPVASSEYNQPSCYLMTKAFRGLANSYPMVGLSVTNGEPLTTAPLQQAVQNENSKFEYKFVTGTTNVDPSSGNSSEGQPCKHPMGVIACPQSEEQVLRPVARFGVDKVVEAEDVFPYETGVAGDTNADGSVVAGTGVSFVNTASRWLSAGLSNVKTTEVANQHIFSYKSRLVAGISRLTDFNRLKVSLLGPQHSGVGPSVGGCVFTSNAAGAFGGELVELSLDAPKLTAVQDGPQTLFSGGYLGFFDGVHNGESDPHTSPGKPYIQLYRSTDTHKPLKTHATDYSNFTTVYDTKYTFVTVYALEDYDGRVHRSAPSPETTVYGNAATLVPGADQGPVALRYLMPPPSAFSTYEDTLAPAWSAVRQGKLFVEVYVKVISAVPEKQATNFTLIDRFRPTLVQNLQQRGSTGTVATDDTTSTTPWTDEVRQGGRVRSGFRFFGERVLRDPIFLASASIRSEYDGAAQVDIPTFQSGQMLDTLLYTTGGVIENDPPPAFIDIAVGNKRMWGIPGDNRSSVWYSKLLSTGKAPEWSAAYTIAMPRGADRLTAISSMDEKVVMFSRDDIFILLGDGPNNLGRGGSFTGPRKIASDVGCVNKSSIVTGPFGVMFQSSKGIYVLTRDLQVSYIGSNVEDQITSHSDITSAVLVEDKNQVRFSLNQLGQTNLKLLCYDYYHQSWTMFSSDSNVVTNTTSAAIVNSKYTVLGIDNYISQEARSSYFDGNGGAQQPIVSKFITAWIRLAGLQGFKRVKRAFFLAQHLGGKVSLSAQYNYNEGVSTTKSWTNAEIVALSTDPMQLGLHIPRQKCESIRFVYSDEDVGAPPADGGIISSVSIQVGTKSGMFKMSEGSKK